MKTRSQKIATGKLWQVYPDPGKDNPLKESTIEFEGSRTACLRYIREKHGMRAYKNGTMRIGQLIYER